MLIVPKAATKPTERDRVAAERIQIVCHNLPVGVLGAFFGAAVLAWTLIDSDPTTRGRVLVWLTVTTVVAAWQLALWLTYWIARPRQSAWRSWALAISLSSFVEGCRWALGEIWLATPGNIDQQLWPPEMLDNSPLTNCSAEHKTKLPH